MTYNKIYVPTSNASTINQLRAVVSNFGYLWPSNLTWTPYEYIVVNLANGNISTAKRPNQGKNILVTANIKLIIPTIQTDGNRRPQPEPDPYDGILILSASQNITLTNAEIGEIGGTIDKSFFTKFYSANGHNCSNLLTLSLWLTNIKQANVENNPNLQKIDIYNNNLTSLAVNNNAALTYLDASTNQLSGTVNISNCPKLEKFYAASNNLTSLNIASNPSLSLVDVQSNNLTSLNTNNQPNLQSIYVNNNPNFTTYNITNNPSLRYFIANNTNITSFTVTSSTTLSNLALQDCPALTTLTATSCSNISTIEAYSCPSLSFVNVNASAVPTSATFFNLSGSPIQTLSASNCNLASFPGVTNLPYLRPTLKYVDLSNNNITSGNLTSIITQLVSGSLTSGSLNISGGTTSTGSAQANDAINTLITRSWSVSKNS